MSFSTDMRVPWCLTLADLPDMPVGSAEPGFANHQHPDG
jgi:hypothetical protein